ncbi:MAG: NUDIX domain-containing protein [Candidatus Binatia bacterium]|nr:NUDIX domain-containing protein [Candidatus Binatia bacterium]
MSSGPTPSKSPRASKQTASKRGKEVSAGCVVTRVHNGVTEVLLVHPRGATFRKPLFGIPKGHVEPGEQPEEAAVRETKEETGLDVHIVGDLGTIRQKSGKVVHGYWAVLDPRSAAAIDERGRCIKSDGHEVDVCRFYPLDRAEPLMIPAQREFLMRLRERLQTGYPQDSGQPRTEGSGRS